MNRTYVVAVKVPSEVGRSGYTKRFVVVANNSQRARNFVQSSASPYWPANATFTIEKNLLLDSIFPI